jgi:hypothetical protein
VADKLSTWSVRRSVRPAQTKDKSSQTTLTALILKDLLRIRCTCTKELQWLMPCDSAVEEFVMPRSQAQILSTLINQDY